MQKFSHPVALAYCADNAAIATQISQELATVIDFNLFTHEQDGPGNLSAQLASFNGPILLLISDNFLRSVACMEGGLSFLNARQNDILPVIIPGVTTNAEGALTSTATDLERVSDIIQYINYWQDRYLDLRRQKNEDEDLASDAGFADYVKRVREISGQAGEYIRLLRGIWHLSWQEFSHNHYEQLFIFLEEPELGAAVREARPVADTSAIEEQDTVAESSDPAMAAESEDRTTEDDFDYNVSDIPGLSLLNEDPLPPAVEPEEDESTPTDTKADAAAEEDLATLIHKAWVMMDGEESEEGLAILEAALENYPEELDLRYNYSLMLAQAGRTEAATKEVEMVLERAPEHADALFLAGELADVRGEGALARDYYQQILLLNDELSEVWHQLGMIQMGYFPEEGEATETAFKKAYKFDKSNTEALYQLAQFYLREGQEDKAIRRLEQLLQQTPKRALARYDLALLYHRQGNLTAAQGAYLQAAALQPELRTDTNDEAFQVGTDLSVAGMVSEELDQLRARVRELEATLAQKETEANTDESQAAPEIGIPPRPGAGKCVMVTGATAGIGKATAHKFAQLGYDLILTGRREDRLHTLAEEWEETYGVEIKLLVFDVRDAEAVEAAVDGLKGSDWQAIDILVNNAGKAKGLDFVHEGELAHWDEMVDTNIKGLLYVSRAVIPLMVDRGGGHIVNLCSTAGKEVYPKGAVYCATKHAVDALTQGMRLDLHTHGIRVSQVCPAHVEETEFAEVRFDGDKQKAKIYEDFQPLRSSDVAEVIAFLTQQPAHVNILDVVLQGTQQASSTLIDRSGRDKYAPQA